MVHVPDSPASPRCASLGLGISWRVMRQSASQFHCSGCFRKISGGKIAVKAILTSPDNHGPLCDMMGDGRGHGGDTFVDDQRCVFDVLVGS